MMAQAAVRSVFFTPPVAIARLGASDTPVDAYEWRCDMATGLTVLEPTVSLSIAADGSVEPQSVRELVFRDDSGLRPVAPFLELCVEFEDGSTRPLTSALLDKLGGSLAAVSYVVTAANRKAERRTGDPACGFSATVQFDHTDPRDRPLLASSTGRNPLVSPEKPVPLGSIRAVLPVQVPVDASRVDRDVLRLRFTPAKGLVYGPPSAVEGRIPARGTPLALEIVRPQHRILNEGSSWTSYTLDDATLRHPVPGDTYDGSGDATEGHGERSWGVVDDTCDVVVNATVRLGGEAHVARARVFASPPDYAPDKRPFQSLSDDLLDREAPDPELDAIDTEEAVVDLLRRAFESVSLNDVDSQRQRAIERGNTGLADFLISVAPTPEIAARLRARLGRDGAPAQPPLADPRSMTDDDEGYRAGDRNQIRPDVPRPFTELARDAHSVMIASSLLLPFLTEDAERVRRLLRPPYALVRESEPTDPEPPEGRRRPWDPEAWLHDMRMPPYMRDSDGSPLSLTRRQYVEVMSLLDQLTSPALRRLALEADLRTVTAREPENADALFRAFQETDLTRTVPERGA